MSKIGNNSPPRTTSTGEVGAVEAAGTRRAGAAAGDQVQITDEMRTAFRARDTVTLARLIREQQLAHGGGLMAKVSPEAIITKDGTDAGASIVLDRIIA